jgi:hypothetical protein
MIAWLLGTEAGQGLVIAVLTAAITSAAHWIYHLAMHDKRTENVAILALIAAEVVEAGIKGAVIAPSRDKLIQYAVVAAKDKLVARLGDIEKAFGGEADYLIHGAVVKEVGVGNVTVNLPGA